MIAPDAKHLMTRDSQVKLRCISFQPRTGGAPGGWFTYDAADVSRRLDDMVAGGWNCVKRNATGINSSSNSYPDDATFKGMLADWCSQLRQRKLKWYLNNSPANAVFGVDGSQVVANTARACQVLQWIIELGADLIVGYDLINELGGGSPTSWGTGTLNNAQARADCRYLKQQVKTVAPWLPVSFSVYIDTWSSSDRQVALKFAADAQCDFHDYHPYEGKDGLTTLTPAQAPSVANLITWLENQSWFIGRHFAGECGILSQNSDAAVGAWYEALGDQTRRTASLGLNTFCDVNFNGGNYGVVNRAQAIAAVQKMPGLL